MRDPFSITELVTLMANLTAQYFTPDELAILAALFTQYADTLAVIAATSLQKEE